ncbi:MAG: endonuclease/exonuclease/phosphatase family protein [Bacteroidales bacterium]
MRAMIKKIIILLFCGVLWIPGYAQQKQDTLRVMTYNLRFGELASMQEIADYIKSENPDVVALQEVDWKTNRERAPRQNGVAMLNELAFYTGMFGVYAKAIDYRSGYYGIGILSKYPVLSSERVLLPNPSPEKEQRVMLTAQIELPDHQPLTFVCTHLEVSAEEKRIAQIRFIRQQVKKVKGPVLIAGDFNARPDSKVIREEMKGWVNATNEENTYHTKNPNIKIDYIYMLPNRGLEMLNTKRGEAKLSDHFPIVTDFLIQ